MYNFESNLKNNLIFYGVGQEERETSEKLLLKVKDVMKSHMKISREIHISHVSRVYSGPEVQGYRPVLVSFENYRDKEDVLQASKCLRNSLISVTEDLSKKTRESRQELRKFMRHIKKTAPEKKCFMQHDKLFVDGKMFVFNEIHGNVEEMSSEETVSITTGHQPMTR